MKKTLLNIALLGAIALNITGCVRTIDGNILVPTESNAKINNTTKLYYEDTNNPIIKDNIKNIVDYLNNHKVDTKKLFVSNTKEEVKKVSDFSALFYNNKPGEILDLKFSMDDSSNAIVVEKKYTSRNEAYLEYLKIVNFIREEVIAHPELKDQFGTSASFYYVNEAALNNGQLKFTTKREMARAALSDKLVKIYSNSGYQVVSDAKDADRIVYFQLTRDYYKEEIQQLKKEGKGIDFGVIESGISNQVNVMQTSMNVASNQNSSASSIGIGLGAGLIVGILTSDRNPNFIFPTFKMIDVKDNKAYLINTNALSLIAQFNPGYSDKSEEYDFRYDELNSLYGTLIKANEGKKYILTPLN